ncbi:MAG: universal stress protein [Rhodospirillales bacterium]|nr:universal stress protein [Rhodospirillales bacterium]
MAIKTVLVHLAGETSDKPALAVATHLARTHKAHLKVDHIEESADMPAQVIGRSASFVYLDHAKSARQDRDKTLKAQLDAQFAGAKGSWEWTAAEGDPAAVLAAEARAADLLVVGQSEPHNIEDYLSESVAEKLSVGGGCPVIVVPAAPRRTEAGRRIMIAWKNSQAAARAVRDAMSLLEAAEHVVLFTIAADPQISPADAAMMAHLQRHGLRIERQTDPGSGNDGKTILDQAHKHDCDLLIMGAYDHSRLRELVLGGVTRYVLRHFDIPVLFSH